MGTKFGANVSNGMLLNVATFQGYSFYRSRVINGKPTGGGEGGKITSGWLLMKISLALLHLLMNNQVQFVCLFVCVFVVLCSA